MPEERPVKHGLGELDRKMTKQQAQRYGDRTMPRDLKRAGFKTVIFESTIALNGSLFFRINYTHKY